jgi:hypothetical protein
MNEGEAEQAPEVVVVSDNDDNDFEAPLPKKRVKNPKRPLDPLTYPEAKQFAPASPVADAQSALPDYVAFDPKKKKTLRALAQQAASKPKSNRNDAVRSKREEEQPQGCAPPPKFDNPSSSDSDGDDATKHRKRAPLKAVKPSGSLQHYI